MEERVKKVRLYSRCESLREALSAVFRASYYFGPRPDEVLRAMVRCNLVEYREANDLLRSEIERVVNFKSQVQDREACWKESEAEKKRLMKLHIKFRAEQIKLRGNVEAMKISRGKSDEQVVEAITAELEKLRQPLPPEAT